MKNFKVHFQIFNRYDHYLMVKAIDEVQAKQIYEVYIKQFTWGNKQAPCNLVYIIQQN